jgi:proprotein convertase subtilisin/kexin type 5
VCFNKTYCVTCVSGYYVKTISTTTTTCEVCTLPCLQCFGTATNCTDCNSGRVLNSTSGTCMCLTGYYPDTATTCAPCSPLLGSCLSCNTNSTCLSCWTNAYFKMGTANGVAAKICDLCQVTCLTCSVWYNICATCDALANRVLNTVTKQCDCMTGYTETAGRCLNCTATF